MVDPTEPCPECGGTGYCGPGGRCAGYGTVVPADPQHPAVPFEQAVDLLTGEPRQLRPQHPDIAALVERAKRTRMHDARFHPAEVIALIDDMAAALRTLARPVEDEAVRTTAAFLAESGNERVREAASLLARLAREKASAEDRADALRSHVECLLLVIDDHSLRPMLSGDALEVVEGAERALAAAAGAEEPR